MIVTSIIDQIQEEKVNKSFLIIEPCYYIKIDFFENLTPFNKTKAKMSSTRYSRHIDKVK